MNKSDNGSDQPRKSDGIPGNGSDGWALFSLCVLISILVNTPGRRFRWPDPEGTCRKETKKTLDPAGIHQNIEAVFRPENFRPVSGGKAQESDRNAPEKIQKFSGRYTTSMFWCIPAGTVLYSLTWEYMHFYFYLSDFRWKIIAYDNLFILHGNIRKEHISKQRILCFDELKL